MLNKNDMITVACWKAHIISHVIIIFCALLFFKKDKQKR